MSFSLPPLPYAVDTLAPHISAESKISFSFMVSLKHLIAMDYNKHHKNYVDNLNKLIKSTTEYKK
jgi:superoxide dismutase, Fe-Mn family